MLILALPTLPLTMGRCVVYALQIDEVVGDRTPGLDDIGALRLTMRVIAEAMRLYPQPPVLIRRALNNDTLGGFSVVAGSDIFISVWNIHRHAFRFLNMRSVLNITGVWPAGVARLLCITQRVRGCSITVGSLFTGAGMPATGKTLKVLTLTASRSMGPCPTR